MYILGISAFYHDSAAALVCDGEIVAAVSEERFTRIKQDYNFPYHSVQYCLKCAGITVKDIDAVVFYDKPLLNLKDCWKHISHLHLKELPLFKRQFPYGLNRSCLYRKR